MVHRKDGGFQRMATRKHLSREARIQERRTRHEHLQEIYVEPVVIAPDPPNVWRTWYERNVHEILLSTGWGGFAGEVWAYPDEWPPFHKMLAVETLMGVLRSSDKFILTVTRLYPGRIEVDNCDKSHRCAILDIARENRYRDLSPKQGSHREAGQGHKAVELLLEEKCECFWDAHRGHEARLVFYEW